MEESTGSKQENPELDQDDSWEDLTGEYEKVEGCSTPEDSGKKQPQAEVKLSCSNPELSTKVHSQEEERESCSTTEDSIKEYPESEENESSCTPEDSYKEYSESEEKESCSTSEDFTKESSEEGKENGALQKLPSFEVLTEFPKPDFLKLREDVFTQQQTTFAFKNMTTSGCSFIGLKRRVHKKANLFPNNQVDLGRQVAIKTKKNSGRKKHKKTNITLPASGLVLALFATNVITFVLGCSLGWWSRDAIPTLAVYEFHLDPALL